MHPASIPSYHPCFIARFKNIDIPSILIGHRVWSDRIHLFNTFCIDKNYYESNGMDFVWLRSFSSAVPPIFPKKLLPNLKMSTFHQLQSVIGPKTIKFTYSLPFVSIKSTEDRMIRTFFGCTPPQVLFLLFFQKLFFPKIVIVKFENFGIWSISIDCRAWNDRIHSINTFCIDLNYCESNGMNFVWLYSSLSAVSPTFPKNECFSISHPFWSVFFASVGKFDPSLSLSSNAII